MTLLRNELATYRSTSIRTRIQKNINLLSLEGKAAPALDAREFLDRSRLPWRRSGANRSCCSSGRTGAATASKKSRFWSAIRKEYASKGLVLIAPTQRYGYVARGEEAGPEAELKYIEQVRHVYLADLLNVPAPVSEANFKLTAPVRPRRWC